MKKLGFKMRQEQAFNLDKAINFLNSVKINPLIEYYDFLIKNKINLSTLKSSLELPYELILININGKIHLRTDSGEGGYNNDLEYMNRQNLAKTILHTHYLKEGISLNSPSISDVFHSYFHKNAELAVVHNEGITVYSHPKINPKTGKEFEPIGHITDLVSPFYDDKKISTLFEKVGFTSLNSLNKIERYSLQREYAEKSGMIIKEANWKETEKFETILNQLFK